MPEIVGRQSDEIYVVKKFRPSEIQGKPHTNPKNLTLSQFLDRMKWQERGNEGLYRIQNSTRYTVEASEFDFGPFV